MTKTIARWLLRKELAELKTRLGETLIENKRLHDKNMGLAGHLLETRRLWVAYVTGGEEQMETRQ